MSEEVFLKIYANKTMIQNLLYAVNFAYEKWPGGDPEQQQMLDQLRNRLFACSLEFEVD
tara:strand:- start:1573 stop:1749 length:177 start_codon:yes stop_codon:yes gene_type:complete